eukprot:766142-Prorocentrum_lima.AAC.1
MALRMRLAIPVLEDFATCSNSANFSQRRCDLPLDPDADHVFQCARGAIIRRHNEIRDTWQSMAQQAGALTLPDPVVGALQPRLLPNWGRKQIKADLQ